MAREMYLAGVDPEDLKPSAPIQPPKTPKDWLSNFWYHNKWIFLLAVFIVAVLIVVIVQMVTREKPDYTVVLVTEQPYLTEHLDPLERSLAAYGSDLNGDGTVVVQVRNCYLGGSDYRSFIGNSQSFQAHLITGDVMLFAFEPAYAEKFQTVSDGESHSFLTPLSFAADGITEDGLAWNWKDDPRQTEDPAWAELPKELLFGVRLASGTAADQQSVQQQCLAFLQALATASPNEK